MYDLIITWHGFREQDVKEILRATGITLDAAIEILKMYNYTPSLEIKLLKIIELHPTPEQIEKINNFSKLNSVYGVLSSDTCDKLRKVEEEYNARLHDETDSNTVL